MSKGIVVEGDPLSGGGSVVKGSGYTINGLHIALLGDPISCAIPWHGAGTIIEGDPNVLVSGKPVALHGHKASCGCTLIAATFGTGHKVGPTEKTEPPKEEILFKLYNKVTNSLFDKLDSVIPAETKENLCKTYEILNSEEHNLPPVLKGKTKLNPSHLRQSPGHEISKILINSWCDRYKTGEKQPKVESPPKQTKLDCSNNKYKGGPHSETRLPIGDGLDSHHIPAKKAYEGSKMNPNGKAMQGPAIKMDPEDHKETLSHGSKSKSKEYIAKQRELIKQGKVYEVVKMDIDNIQNIADKNGHPDKYKCAIQELQDYIDNLNPNDFIPTKL